MSDYRSVTDLVTRARNGDKRAWDGLVISCARQASGTCCPALMTLPQQHLAHRGVHVVIKQESH
jgi:hypothetical protein